MDISFILSFIHILAELLIWAVLIRVILSWFQPRLSNPVVRMIYGIAEPFLILARRIIPPTRMGLDFSPIVAWLGIEVIRMLLVYSISTWIA